MIYRLKYFRWNGSKMIHLMVAKSLISENDQLIWNCWWFWYVINKTRPINRTWLDNLNLGVETELFSGHLTNLNRKNSQNIFISFRSIHFGVETELVKIVGNWLKLVKMSTFEPKTSMKSNFWKHWQEIGEKWSGNQNIGFIPFKLLKNGCKILNFL